MKERTTELGARFQTTEEKRKFLEAGLAGELMVVAGNGEKERIGGGKGVTDEEMVVTDVEIVGSLQEVDPTRGTRYPVNQPGGTRTDTMG